MSQGQLQNAVALLLSHYGRDVLPVMSPSWQTLVDVVIDRMKFGSDGYDRIENSVLATPASTSSALVDEIVAALDRVSRARKKAAVLKALADWWTVRFGDQQHIDADEWCTAAETIRVELRRIRGVGLEMVDRILLCVGGVPAYPLDRGSTRVAGRHGWVGFESEYEEWQSLFVDGCDADPIELLQLSDWLSRVGSEFCGPKPNCDGCPLESLLPDAGPYEPDVG